MKSTVAIFRHLYNRLPPLFPAETANKMKHALEHLESDPSITLHEVEKTMIIFGYEIWPWNQAYREFLSLAEGKVGEHFLLPKLSKKLQAKYQEFKLSGGSLRDLHSGRPADYFGIDERNELCVALVNTQKELRDFVTREVVGLDKSKYLQRVDTFRNVLGAIKKQLNEMRILADREQDHPILANEIRERVKMFEQGLCLLAPELDYEAVCQSVDHFTGRKLDLNWMRGTHLPADVDFFGDKI